MKNALIAAAAILSLSMGSASVFAAEQNGQGSDQGAAANQENTAQHDSSINSSTECDNIMANQSAYSRDQVASCKREVR